MFAIVAANPSPIWSAWRQFVGHADTRLIPIPAIGTPTSANNYGFRAALQQTACKLGHPLLYGGAEDLMAGVYSTDLRERVLVAVEAGEPATRSQSNS